jgi:hypothetical protein
VLQLVNKVDHVLAHWRALNLVDVSPVLVARVLGLQLLDDLLAKAAHFGRALNRHVLRALVSERRKEDGLEFAEIIFKKAGTVPVNTGTM